MKICFIIPVHNEAEKIGGIVKAIRGYGHDVLVIDDGSKDESGTIAEKEGARVITNDVKEGKGYSLQKGFEWALAKDYDGVVTMDGDGQHAVEDIPLFLDNIGRFSQCVITGNRMANPQGMPRVRFLTNLWMSRWISMMCGQVIPDTQCGYRYVSRRILSQLRLTSSDFEIETEVLMQASRLGCKILSIPIQTIYRDEKSKINPFKDTIRFFMYLIRESILRPRNRR